MTGKMRYKQDLSLRENIFFVLLFLLPWLGILLLIMRKRNITRTQVFVHDYLLLVTSVLFWAFFFSTTNGILLALVVAALGSLCFATFLLLIEECRMARWSVSVGGVPIVVWLSAIVLPVMFFQLAILMRNIPVGNVAECPSEMRTAGVVVLLAIV